MLIVSSVLVFLIILGIFHFRYPFIYKHRGKQKWSVGISRSDENALGHIVSTLDSEMLKKKYGFDGIADPWMISAEDGLYLFVEVLKVFKGELRVFKSNDLHDWTLIGEPLKEDYHLSYPQVISKNNTYYLLPETAKAEKVILYKSTNWPLRWEQSETWLEGEYLDTTYFEYKGNHYLINVDRNSVCHLFVSFEFENAEWQEHPKSPLGIGNRFRPGGSPIVTDQEVIIPVQCRRKGYGTAVYQLILTELTATELKFRKGKAMLKAIDGTIFNSGIHHMDYFKFRGENYVVFDGRGGKGMSYRIINFKRSFKENIYDILSSIHYPKHLPFLDNW